MLGLDKSDKATDYDDSDRLNRYITNISLAFSALSRNNDESRANKEFIYGDQWGDQRYLREQNEQVTLQFNFLRPVIRGITGEQSYNTPEFQVRAMDDKTNPKEVEVVDGMLRHVAYESKFPYVTRITFKNQLICGRGAMYVYTDYEDDMSFKKVIKFAAVEDVSRVYFDPAAQTQSKQDGKYQGFITVIPAEEYKQQYGELPARRISFGQGIEQMLNVVFVVDHFEKEFYEETLVETSSGETMLLSDYKDQLDKLSDEHAALLRIYPLANSPEAPVIINQRKTTLYKIMHCRLNGERIIEEVEWESKYLPIINVPGDSEIIEGEERYFSYIEDVKDAQKMYNYGISEIADSMSRAHKEQFFATPDQLKGFEEMYTNPSAVQGALLYNADPATGGSPPVPNAAPAFNSAFLKANEDIKNDMQAILGRYEEGRGQQSNAVAGVAIANRQIAENKSLEIFYANLNEGIQMLLQIGASLVPSIYSDDRVVMHMDRRLKTKAIRINHEKSSENGIKSAENEIKKLKYSVALLPGPSYAIQKQIGMQQFKDLFEIAKSPAFQYVGDEYARNMQVNNANEIADRLSVLVPPNAMAAGNGDPPPPPPPPTIQQKLAALELAVQAADAKAQLNKSQATNIQSITNAFKSVEEYRGEAVQSEAKAATAIADILKAAAESPPAVAQTDVNLAKDIQNNQEALLQENNRLLTMLLGALSASQNTQSPPAR